MQEMHHNMQYLRFYADEGGPMSKEQQMIKEQRLEQETDFPLYLYHHGKNDRIYEVFGAHKKTVDGEEGYMFRVWAPHAQQVSVVGDFNGWNAEANVMQRMVDGETFELFIPGLKQYDVYKYCVTAADGRQLMKADPIGFHTETPPRRLPSSTISKGMNGKTAPISKRFTKRMSIPRR